MERNATGCLSVRFTASFSNYWPKSWQYKDVLPNYPPLGPKATEMVRFLGINVKRMAPCRCLDAHVKESYEMSMAWEPDHRSNFFFSPHAHLCAVTCITEISLNVTLNKQPTYSTPYCRIMAMLTTINDGAL